MNQRLDSMFSPTSIALIGVGGRSDSVGALILRNLTRSGFPGKIFIVNPKYNQLHGRICYSSLRDIDAPIDLAIITAPAGVVAEIMESCGEHKIGYTIVISAGFRESGAEGAILANQVSDIARRLGIRVLGPNCLGVLRPKARLNATFSMGSARPGNLALISQSGALCTAMLDWADQNHIGFSLMVSLGESIDIDFNDVLNYVREDTETAAVLLYIEGIARGREFATALSRVTKNKPVLVVKVGRHQAGSKAALSHTGAIVGADEVFDAVLERCGAVRVNDFIQLFSAAKALTYRMRPVGKRLAIITNGGGPGVMAADRAADLKIEVIELGQDTIASLNRVLPVTWSHNNPVDVIGDATPQRYAEAVRFCLSDPKVDGLLVILTPQAMTHPLEVARTVIEITKEHEKPVLACWMGGTLVASSHEAFREAGIPCFHTPGIAIEVFSFISVYYRNRQFSLDMPMVSTSSLTLERNRAMSLIDHTLADGRQVLTLEESQALISIFDIPIVPAEVARSAAEAGEFAARLGSPVAMKINSPDITHKLDVGGVRLNVKDSQEASVCYEHILSEVKLMRPDARILGISIEPMISKTDARELIVGIRRDPVFGPVIAFGAGGSMVEVFRDKAIMLPPLNRALIRELINRTKIVKLLQQFRNLPSINFDALENLLLRVSHMACELPSLEELDFNPVIAHESGVIVVDARIVVAKRVDLAGPYDHLSLTPS